MPDRHPEIPDHDDSLSRIRLDLKGAVQGVGFRPFVYRLATELGIKGWVGNSNQGVVIEAEGTGAMLDSLRARLESEKPPRAAILECRERTIPPTGDAGFEIRHSEAQADKTALVLPDIALCADCLREIRDPHDRRHLYPFTNCTNCGPRYSIIEALPYDRANTTMKAFAMCRRCRGEYEDPASRRFHAQPNACPDCGPQLALWGESGEARATRHRALEEAAEALRGGAIVAVKGLGGFHLMVDARDGAAVVRLRRRKHREEKPLAVMFPSLADAGEQCEVSEIEKGLLESPEAPIVLLRRLMPAPAAPPIAAAVAPGNPYLGALLPYTPLHRLLMDEVGFPVVATSGNISDEPIATDEREALARLAGIADLFLVHDRPIHRHVDDSVVRTVLGRVLMLRRARGYAPFPMRMARLAPPVIALGGHFKNTVATTVKDQVFISPHIGDLDTAPADAAFRKSVDGLLGLHDVRPVAAVCDAHPDYRSTHFARGLGLPVISVQHHHAHILSCMADNGIAGPLLGVAWDGTGYGTDGTVWGGEFLRIGEDGGFERAAAFRTFPLPGGEKAVEEPRRAALGLLHQIFGDAVFGMETLAPVRAFPVKDRAVLGRMIGRGVNAPHTSSAGRLFDAVAAILDIRQEKGFEGQAAMMLEFACDGAESDAYYEIGITKGGEGESRPRLVLDWEPMIREIVQDVGRGEPASRVSAAFHDTLARTIVAVAREVGEKRVALSGGCFQNRRLTELAVHGLMAEGFTPYWHRLVPPNDGGLSLGQAAWAARRLMKEQE